MTFLGHGIRSTVTGHVEPLAAYSTMMVSREYDDRARARVDHAARRRELRRRLAREQARALFLEVFG